MIPYWDLSQEGKKKRSIAAGIVMLIIAIIMTIALVMLNLNTDITIDSLAIKINLLLYIFFVAFLIQAYIEKKG